MPTGPGLNCLVTAIESVGAEMKKPTAFPEFWARVWQTVDAVTNAVLDTWLATQAVAETPVIVKVNEVPGLRAVRPPDQSKRVPVPTSVTVAAPNPAGLSVV